MTTEETNIGFQNIVENTEELNIFKYRNFYNGGGVGIGDINNDGLADIIFTANQGDNKLYLNQQNFKFKDISSVSGIVGKNKWSTGVVLVDINADGWLDIYICNAGNIAGDDQKNELYINNKDLTFTESAEAYNLADNGFTTHAVFFDYDLDGDLDVYLLNNSFVPVNSLSYSNKRALRSEDWNVKDFLKGGGDKLLRNDNNYFTDVSAAAGIYGSLIGFGLGINAGDINGDGWPDIYVCNDFYERDYLYINQKNGTFSEEIEKWAPHISLSSMGADLSDINNDGYPDIFVSDMLVEANDRLKETSEFERHKLFDFKQKKGFHRQYMQNTLQLNNGNQSFSEIAYHAGVAMTDWSWGALLFDMDNDGYKDIFVSNGIYHDLTNQDFMDFFAGNIIDKMIKTGKKAEMNTLVDKMPSTPVANYAFRNNGDLTFSNMAPEWGFNETTFSNGTAYGDLDNDGDLDLVINNVNQPSFIYRNESRSKTSNTYLQVKLIGKGLNRFGIGSTVSIYTKEEVIQQQLQPSRGFQSSVDYVLTFGTGARSKIDSIVVVWPDRSQQLETNVNTNQLLTFNQADSAPSYGEKGPTLNGNLIAKGNNDGLLKHNENRYTDFDHEGLIYKMLSKEGPVVISSDVNNDGLEDLFIGGPKGQMGQIYLQGSKGFKAVNLQSLADDLDYEDTAASFLDANGDGYLDLLVGSGGNQKERKKNGFDLRLYINDGSGKFEKKELQIPLNVYNTAVIAPYDFDQDGDVDIFVGSRSIPGLFGLDPRHYLLENDGKGNFENSLGEKAAELKNIGMITDAKWKDMDHDGISDLILTEDWGGVHIYQNKNGRLQPISSNLNQLNGWWRSVVAEDLNNDGHVDLILGNRGINSIYKADSANVVKMYINDFDNNGTVDQVFTTMIDGRDVPVHLKRELTEQLTILKKDNLKFSEYATKSIDDLFPKNKLERAIKKHVNFSKSIFAINNGDNTFSVKNLPVQAQFSCINDMVLVDVNDDEVLDLVYGGNDYSLKPQFSQLDASFGGVLLGDDKGDFQWLDYQSSGFFIPGVINSLQTFRSIDQQTNIVVGLNDDVPRIYKLRSKR